MVRVEAGLFFASAVHVQVKIECLGFAHTGLVVFDAETLPFTDVIALNMLVGLDQSLNRRGNELRPARDIGQFCAVTATTPTNPAGRFHRSRRSRS